MLDRIRRRIVNNDRGSVLVLTVVFSIATIALGAAYLQYVDHQRAIINEQTAVYKVKGAAYSIMAQGMADHPSSGRFRSAKTVYYDDGCTRVEVQYYSEVGGHNNGNYSSTSQYEMCGISYLTSCDLPGEIVDTVCHDMSSHSYADFLYLTDKETQSYRPVGDDTLRFWGPDTLDGKVHSNDMLHFQQGNGYWPVFYEEVTSCSTRFSPPYVTNPGYVQFLGGFRLGVNYKPFPLQADSVRKHSDPPPYPSPSCIGVSPAAQADSVTEIMLLDNGYIVRHRKQDNGNCSRRRTSYDPDSYYRYSQHLINCEIHPYPASMALFVDGELWVSAPKGMHFNCVNSNEESFFGHGFEGKLTIAASGDIIIPQDILYKSANPNGSVPSSSSDVLGLIAEKHILIWRNAPSTVKIDAGMGAIGNQSSPDHLLPATCLNGNWSIDGRFGTISVDGINCYGENNEKSQLTIYGCLIMKERGLIHTSYNGGTRGFISKNYHYDQRFIQNPPPHFFQTRDVGNYYRERVFGLDFGEWQ